MFYICAYIYVYLHEIPIINMFFRLKWSLTNNSSSLHYFSKTTSEMGGSDRITWEHSRNLSDLMWHRHGGFYYCHQLKLKPLIPEAQSSAFWEQNFIVSAWWKSAYKNP